MNLNRLAAWQKLALLALPCLLMAAVPAALHLSTLHANAVQGQRGAEGGRTVRSVLEVIRLVQQHRGLSNGVLAGNATLVAQRDAKKTEVLGALEAMGSSAPKGLAAESTEISRAFGALAAAVDARALP